MKSNSSNIFIRARSKKTAPTCLRPFAELNILPDHNIRCYTFLQFIILFPALQHEKDTAEMPSTSKQTETACAIFQPGDLQAAQVNPNDYSPSISHSFAPSSSSFNVLDLLTPWPIGPTQPGQAVPVYFGQPYTEPDPNPKPATKQTFDMSISDIEIVVNKSLEDMHINCDTNNETINPHVDPLGLDTTNEFYLQTDDPVDNGQLDDIDSSTLSDMIDGILTNDMLPTTNDWSLSSFGEILLNMRKSELDENVPGERKT